MSRMPTCGYFTAAEQTEPDFDPGLTVECPVCEDILERPVKTISLMPMNSPKASMFFRAHKACWDGLTRAQQIDIESLVIDAEVAGLQ